MTRAGKKNLSVMWKVLRMLTERDFSSGDGASIKLLRDDGELGVKVGQRFRRLPVLHGTLVESLA